MNLKNFAFRANLFFEVFPKEHGIAGDVKRFMKQNDDGSFCFKGSTIIYCPTRRQAEEVCRVLDGDRLIFHSFFVYLLINEWLF